MDIGRIRKRAGTTLTEWNQTCWRWIEQRVCCWRPALWRKVLGCWLGFPGSRVVVSLGSLGSARLPGCPLGCWGAGSGSRVPAWLFPWVPWVPWVPLGARPAGGCARARPAGGCARKALRAKRVPWVPWVAWVLWAPWVPWIPCVHWLPTAVRHLAVSLGSLGSLVYHLDTFWIQLGHQKASKQGWPQSGPPRHHLDNTWTPLGYDILIYCHTAWIPFG